jgi:aspartyl-tRNA(Asn)/glutamyl-tRNA(Gln) amidotransferase subunit C
VDNRTRRRPRAVVGCWSVQERRGYDRAMISRSDVEHVARLARLGLTDKEIDLLVPQLTRILEAVGKLAEVDTSAVGPTAQVIALENVMREDVATPPQGRDVALAEAPLREGGLVRVPVVLEEGR